MKQYWTDESDKSSQGRQDYRNGYKVVVKGKGRRSAAAHKSKAEHAKDTGTRMDVIVKEVEYKARSNWETKNLLLLGF